MQLDSRGSLSYNIHRNQEIADIWAFINTKNGCSAEPFKYFNIYQTGTRFSWDEFILFIYKTEYKH